MKKTPVEWQAYEGTKIHNHFVFHVDGRTCEDVIDYETYSEIRRPLTVQFLPMWQTDPTSEFNRGVTTTSTTVTLYPSTDSVSKRLLRERIETKLEEFKEARTYAYSDDDSFDFEYWPDAMREDGIEQGLELALQILAES